MDFVQVIADLDQSPALHMARLLLILDAFAEDSQGEAMEGLTKLAKLDFLLRYPVVLRRALEAKGYSTRAIRLADHESLSVESEMARYRFDPWDHRYRTLLSILVSKGLVSVSVEGRKVIIALTSAGRSTASQLAVHELFEQYSQRARLLKKHFNMTAIRLMRLIYDTFPEIVALRPDEAILT